jgi:hypothetical protein
MGDRLSGLEVQFTTTPTTITTKLLLLHIGCNKSITKGCWWYIQFFNSGSSPCHVAVSLCWLFMEMHFPPISRMLNFLD